MTAFMVLPIVPRFTPNKIGRRNRKIRPPASDRVLMPITAPTV
jgi:hypothetical protein